MNYAEKVKARIMSDPIIDKLAPGSDCLVSHARSWMYPQEFGDKIFDRMIKTTTPDDNGDFTIRCRGLVCRSKDSCTVYQAEQPVNLNYDID